ncbi:hypothetical protein Q5H92_25285 [Hymenobacter sp. M29]|uniref:Uncharacterized protein n=1 Tax=Hymenobacter mellowenesis TaxID=3063995 RepID=A0ABT9AIK2_9BACT|nr:hypothetical protein [Hymenobacter sp. M29]MDO7849701.1 hypothetical protein [Hymenobacter sp. M29]
MSRKLNQLIAHYEAERDMLSAQVQECVEEADYGMAKRFTKGLFGVNRQLQTLYNLRDSHHDEQKASIRHIESLEQMMQREPQQERPYLADWIASEQKKLAEWQAQARSPRPQTTAIAEALRKLLGGRITGFTLHFSQREQLYCTFRLTRRTLIITFPEIKRHRKKYGLPKKRIRGFQRLGFHFYDQGDKLMAFQPLATEAEIGGVIRMLTHIAFELFYFREFEQESYLSYYEPTAQ